MDVRNAALREALTAAGVDLQEPVAPGRWRGRHAVGPVLVTVLRPRSRVHRATVQARADRLVTLRHRGVADVVACVGTADRVAVVHREVAGTDLATVLRGRGQWAPGEVLGALADIAEALAALHQVGVVHGDLSPANVLVGTDGRAVLVDLVTGADPTEEGTPGWAAPERATSATPAADVYSLGAIGHRLLERVGRADAGDALARPIGADDAPGHRVDDGEHLRAVRALVERCLSADPVVRPSAAELAGLVRAGAVEPVRPAEPSLLAGALLQEEAARGYDGHRTVRRPKPVRGRHRRRGPARGAAVPLVLVTVVVAAVATGLARGQHTGDAAPGVQGTAPDAVSTARASDGAGGGPVPALPLVLAGEPGSSAAERAATGLTLRRAAALAGGNLPVLLSLTEPGSPAAGVDRALWRPDGLGPGDVEVVEARTSAGADREWRVALEVEAAGRAQGVVLRLVVDDGRWQVRAVEAR